MNSQTLRTRIAAKSRSNEEPSAALPLHGFIGKRVFTISYAGVETGIHFTTRFSLQG
jgi:hypothetical protein